MKRNKKANNTINAEYLILSALEDDSINDNDLIQECCDITGIESHNIKDFIGDRIKFLKNK